MFYFYKINYHSTGVEIFTNYRLSYIQATVNLSRFYLCRNYVTRINNNSTNILKLFMVIDIYKILFWISVNRLHYSRAILQNIFIIFKYS
jgi:hypothetical protein